MKTILTAILLFSSAFAFSQTAIYAIDIPGLHERSGGGAYDKIINSALVSSGKASLEVLPPARAEKSFEACTDCCLSPANLNPEFYSYGSDVVISEPMGIAKIYIFSKPGDKVYSSLAEIKGKKVGIRNGMPYGKSFESAGLSTATTSKITNNINKLDNGRIDVMVAYTPDALEAFSSIGKEPYPYDENSPITEHPDSLVCRGVSDDVLSTFNSYVKGL